MEHLLFKSNLICVMLKLASWTPTLSSSKPESTNNDERTEVITKLTEADALPVHQDAAV